MLCCCKCRPCRCRVISCKSRNRIVPILKHTHASLGTRSRRSKQPKHTDTFDKFIGGFSGNTKEKGYAARHTDPFDRPVRTTLISAKQNNVEPLINTKKNNPKMPTMQQEPCLTLFVSVTEAASSSTSQIYNPGRLRSSG